MVVLSSDHVKGLASTTIAIEPFTGYRASLKAAMVYQYGADLVADMGHEVVDLAVHLHVIEHVKNPIAYLQAKMRGALTTDGVLYLVTPNHASILFTINSQNLRSVFLSYRLIRGISRRNHYNGYLK